MNLRQGPRSREAGMTRRQMMAGVTFALGSFGLVAAKASGQAAEEISHSAESIHLETVFTSLASRRLAFRDLFHRQIRPCRTRLRDEARLRPHRFSQR
jgi:hypothetical protein